MTAAIRATTGNVMADPPVSNKLRKFEVGRTIPVGRLNALVNYANRPPQMGAGGLQRITSPGGGDMYNVPYRGEVLFAELNDSMVDGGRLRKGAGLLVDDGTSQSAAPTKLDHEYEPVMSSHPDDVHLSGEQQFLVYNPSYRHWLPMRGVQIHQGKCSEAGDIGEFGTGNVTIFRDGDYLDVADGSTGFVIQAQDWSGHGCLQGSYVMVWQTLHDRKWYFCDPSFYCGFVNNVASTIIGTSDTEIQFAGGNLSFSKTNPAFGVTGNVFHGNTGGSPLMIADETDNARVIIHIDFSVSFSASLWTELIVQIQSDSGGGYGDIASAQLSVGNPIETIVLAEHGGSIANRKACCSLHAALELDPTSNARKFRAIAKKVLNTSSVCTAIDGQIRVHVEYTGEPNNAAS